MLRSQPLYLVAVVLFFILLGYLGIRTLEHEVLLRHYQTQALARAQGEQIEAHINALLEQKSARLNAISGFVDIQDKAALNTLENTDSDIDMLFVLQKNRLLYPDERETLSNSAQEWIRLLTPLVNDPSQLVSHQPHSEQQIPQDGWFIVNETQEPVLIYWRQQASFIVGFRLSYVKLMMDVANSLQAGDQETGYVLQVTENGRQLYQSRSANLAELRLLDSRALVWPLVTWQINVYGSEPPLWHIWLWGGLLITALLAAVGLLGWSLWRQYTRSARLARQQVDFVSQVSHELKTPLTNITLYAELLREGLDDEQHQEQRYVDVITQEGQRLSRLIQNILTFTRAPKLHYQALTLSRLLAGIVHIFTPAFQAKNIRLNLTCPESTTIESDADAITQIVSNFLSNAEKYAAQGEQVDIEVQTAAGQINISVRDYGPGMTDKEMKMIFRPFYRVKSSITEGVSGTGIGLTIALQLAHRLGGDISVSPQQPGCQFTLSLPLTAPPQPS